MILAGAVLSGQGASPGKKAGGWQQVWHWFSGLIGLISLWVWTVGKSVGMRASSGLAGVQAVGRSVIMVMTVAMALVVALLVAPPEAQARQTQPPGAMQVVSLSSLPPEALVTHRLIFQGGPFPYEKDGTVFRNRERLLPPRARGHYREYTVRTPGLRHRGARRIVCGGLPIHRPDVCFYTDDHYASFRLIQP